MFYYVENKENPFEAFDSDGLTKEPHIHPHLEMIYMQEGSSLALLDDREFLIEQGDLFLSFPNQIHSYQPLCAMKSSLIIFAPDLFPDLKKLFETQLPLSPIIKCSLLAPDTNARIQKIKAMNNSDFPFDRIAAKGYLLAFLSEVFPLMPMNNAPTNHDTLKTLLLYCSENYTEPLTLDTISASLHLNKYYVSHLFKERMHMSFTDFVNHLRVEHACSLLTEHANITEVAFASGFSSIRTFNRVFLQNMNMTPRDYVKMIKNTI